MIKNLQYFMQRATTRLFPYWCPACPKRYRKIVQYHNHYLNCESRLMAEKRYNDSLARIAPKNRAQKRKMAKKAGRIKDWAILND